jgi:broad specificity phosphatase PhoE
MSSLILVRHGQASFFADDYDQLSELGRAQGRLLGDYWVRRGQVFDEVYTGPRARQRQTAELVGAVYVQSSLPWPEPIIVAELDEYDLGGLVHRLAPELARQDRVFAELLAGFQQGLDGDLRLRSFQRAFERLTRHWMTAGDSLNGLETWPAFRERVHGWLRQILAKPGRGRHVAAFTSGGFIGTFVGLALDAPERMALEMSWRVRNCALNEFVFTADRLTLDSFNSVPHLDSPELWTYR